MLGVDSDEPRAIRAWLAAMIQIAVVNNIAAARADSPPLQAHSQRSI
jgi:hypothetical protein